MASFFGRAKLPTRGGVETGLRRAGSLARSLRQYGERTPGATTRSYWLRREVLSLVLLLVALGLMSALQLKALNEKLVQDSSATVTALRASVTEVARLGLDAGDVSGIALYLRELTQGSIVAGVVLSDANSRIVANMWQGDELSQVEIAQKSMSGSWERLAIEDNGRHLGSVSLALEGPSPLIMQRKLMGLLILILCGLVAIPLLTGTIVQRNFNNRTQRACDATARLARGDYSVRIPSTGADPLASLSRSFNHMAGELGRNIAQLRASEERFDLAVNGSNECIWDWRIATDRLYLSPRFSDILGYENAELPGLFPAFQRWVHPEDKLAFDHALQKHLVRDVAFRCEVRLRTKSGAWVWMLARGTAVRSSPGRPVRMAGSFSDISEQKAAQRALGDEKKRAEITLRSIVDGVITTDAQGSIQYMNAAAERLTAWHDEDARELPLLKVFDVIIEDGKPVDEGIMNRVLRTGKAESFGDRCILRNCEGQAYLIKETVAPLRDDQNQITGMVITFNNITERMRLQDALDRQREHALVTLNAIGDAVITTDAHNRVIYMNPAAEELTGRSRADSRNKSFNQVVTFEYEVGGQDLAEPVNALQEKGGNILDLGEAKLVGQRGEVHTVEHQIAPLCNKTQSIDGSVVVLHNVSERHKLMEKLSHQARHDALTQLINRYEFERKLGQAIDHARGDSDAEHVVCYLDLDQFKIVNDSCGHSAGDELLRQVADLFQEHIRHSDTLARLGGDEFGLLLDSCGLGQARQIAEKLRNDMEAFRFCWEEKYFTVSVSIGLYLIKGSFASLQQVLSSVDEACYIAKHKGRNQVHVYQPDDVETNRFHREIESIPDIHKALNENRLLLYAQPIAPINGDCKSLHYEVLLRMRNQRGQILEPRSFLPAAERYGLMPILDRWVVDSAIAALDKDWNLNSTRLVDTVGINISAAVLNDDGFLDHVKMAMERHSVPPDVLCFEITETLAIANFTLARRFVDELKQMGCRFALDDFGSGFASFSNLRALPVDYLKIDGSFVRHMVQKKVDFAMVEVINEIGHIMGLKTIAEFIESPETLEALKGIGVDYAQGYHIGRPIPLSEVFSDEMPIKLAVG